MRVAVLHNLTAGGAHRRLAEQIAAWDAEIVEFTTSLAVPVTPRPYVLPVKVVAPGLPAVLRPPRRPADLRRLRAVWLRLGQLAERDGADVIFANPDSVLRGSMPLGVTATPVLRYCDEPRRIDYEPGLRDTLNPWTRALYAGLRKRERNLDRAAVAAADVIATNSAYSAARLGAAYQRDAAVVPCGAPARMTADLTEPDHLLSVGSLIPGKGHRLVIEAAARSGLNRPVVIVAHRDDRPERQRLLAVADRCGVRADIRVGVGDDELIGLYRRAFATLYLAAAEPLGLVSLEAQACGSPVIVADEGGLPETVAAGRTGLVVPRTAEAAAQALRTLARDGLRGRMSQAAAAGLNGHSWAASAVALGTLAERLAGHDVVGVAA